MEGSTVEVLPARRWATVLTAEDGNRYEIEFDDGSEDCEVVDGTRLVRIPVCLDTMWLMDKCWPDVPTTMPEILPPLAIHKVSGEGGHELRCVSGRSEIAVGGQSRPWTLVYFHGSAELAWIQAKFLAKPFGTALRVRNFFFAEYRGRGGSSGTPTLCNMQRDLSSIVNALDNDTQLIVYGRSIGTVFALALAARYPERVAGLVLESGPAKPVDTDAGLPVFRRMHASDFARIGNEEDVEACVKRFFDTPRRLKAYTGPLLIMHAAADDVIPSSNAALFHQIAHDSAPSRPVNRVKVFNDGDHNTILLESANGASTDLRVELLKELAAFGDEVATHSGANVTSE